MQDDAHEDRQERHEATTKAVRDRVRVIRDDQYRAWIVREVASTGYDRRGGSSLVFVNEDVIRRVRTYPANWSELPDAALYAISLGA